LGLGRTLKETRIKRGISLSDVARELLMQESYLEAIEDEVEGVIPTGTYRKIYTRAYCKFLGIEFRDDPKPAVIAKNSDVKTEQPKSIPREKETPKLRVTERKVQSTETPTDLEFSFDINKVFRMTVKTLILLFILFLIIKFFQWIF
jgi:transcriptional regulator with XRE-family HTH domain